MGLLDGLLGHASEVDPSKVQAEFERILAPGENVERAYQQAVQATPELLSANLHVSLDRERVINVGFWSEASVFHKLIANPPFQNY